MSTEQFWEKFEQFLGDKIPDQVKVVLNKTGFDNAISLSELNSEAIREIEEFVSSEFKFLPGHKVLMLQLSKKILAFQKWVEQNRTPTTEILGSPNVSFIMKELVRTAVANSAVEPTRRRYPDSLRNFAMYLYIMCGKAAYEVISNNIPLPQPSTILSYINNNKQHVIEGELRCKELVDYLKNFDSPMEVWMSEDASGMLLEVKFDSATNQLVGLVLPTNLETGMPIPFSYMPNSVSEIEQQMNNPKSSLVYIVMAQPIKENIPPFILQIFGTDNKFKMESVSRRWEYTKNELSKHNIRIRGISSDADTRLLSCMKLNCKFWLKSSIKNILENIKKEGDITFIQDPIHVLTKLRNRLLKPSILLAMGCKQVTVSHLKVLIDIVDKEEHGLVYSDICPTDRQNYKSLEKCFQDRVLNGLKMHVIGSEGTVTYLKLCRKIELAFTDPHLNPLKRIFYAWHAAFFFRVWRKWILNTRNASDLTYNLRENFISISAYTCVELNAYGLLHLVMRLRDERKPELFLPSMFNSQTCEQTFRQLRSMTTVYWTRINFNLYDLLHMIGRHDLLNSIMYDKLSSTVCFPRAQDQIDKCAIYELPSDDEIRKVLIEARDSALSEAAKLGMHINKDEVLFCDLPKPNNVSLASNSTDINYISDQDSDDDDDDHNAVIENLPEPNDRQSQQMFPAGNKSKFVQVFDNDGTFKNVLKSSVVWALSESKGSLSNDRLKRVQSPLIQSPRKRKANDSENNALTQISGKRSKQNKLSRSNEIKIGEWCLFQQPESVASSSTDSNICVGMVSGFRYIKGRSEKQKQYSLDVVPTSATNTSRLGIEVLANWSKVKNDLSLQPSSQNQCFFLDIENYIATTEVHKRTNDCNTLTVMTTPTELQNILKSSNKKK